MRLLARLACCPYENSQMHFGEILYLEFNLADAVENFVKIAYKTPWSEPADEPYRPSDRRLSAKLVSTFADRGYHVVRVTDPCGRILDFLDRSRYFSFQVAPQL
jgi:hypothetical protein